MKPPLPLCCTPAAFQLMQKQVRSIESPDALLEGAIAIAMHQMPDVDPAQVDRTIQQYTDAIRKRVRGAQPQALLAHLHEFLFEEQKFGGNADDYYNPMNSYLPAVVKTKRGLPISLSLIYKLIGERLGLRVHGIGLPGHFLVAVEQGPVTADGEQPAMLIDPFGGGRMLTGDEAQQAVEETFGEGLEWSNDMLQPVSNLHWLTRMIQNLLHIFGGNGQYADVAAMLELEMLLWPKQTHLQRDLALVLARIGMSHPASEWLNTYLKANPKDPQRGDLEQLLEVLSA
jgi:regulator of sirC expression with transglutaminase-like and TPR domain